MYYIPKVEALDGYKEYVNKLDINDDPVVFGMHKNANMSYQAQETEKLIRVLVSVNKVKDKAGGQTSNEIVLKYCDQIMNSDEINLATIGLFDIRGDLLLEDDRGLKPPLSTVLLQEVDRFNNLLAIIQNSLEKLIAAIGGTIVMSATLDNVYNSLLSNQVPQLWVENAYPSLKPLYSWVRDLASRVAFFRDWVKNGTPKKFALPYFFFPQGFLTGVLQSFARKNTIAIDRLKFEFRVIDPSKDSLEEAPEGGGVYVVGLFLEGARWDKRKILEDQTEGLMYDPMVPIAFIPTEQKEATGREKKAQRVSQHYL